MHPDLRDIHILGKGTYQRLVSPALQRIGVTLAGLSLCRSGFWRQERRPPTGVLSVVLPDAGSGEVLVDGAWRPAGPGSVYLAPPRLRRGWRCGETWHIGWLDFAPEVLPSGLPFVPILQPGNGEALAESVRLLWREQLRDAPSPLVVAHTIDLIGLYLRRLLGADATDARGRLEPLWQTVDAAPAAPWSLRSMGEVVGVGGEQLRRLCHEAHGDSPVAHLRSLRMQRAEALLRSTPLTIAAVAEAVGYADPEAFATAFRRWRGRSPSALRTAGAD